MDIKIKNLQTKIPIHLPKVKDVVRRTFRHFHIIDAELSLVFVTPVRMKALNAKYLKHDYATDILTFDYSERKGDTLLCPLFLQAEIVICPSVVLRNAKDSGTLLHQELGLCVIHGILHLMGYDDHSPRDIARMRKKEQELMALLFF